MSRDQLKRLKELESENTRLTDDIIALTEKFGRYALPGRRLRSNLARGGTA